MEASRLDYQVLDLENTIPLVISRGIRSHSKAVWVRIVADGAEGWGEAGEFGLGDVAQRLPQLEAGLDMARPVIERGTFENKDAILAELRHAHVPSAAIAAIDQALWDWTGKKAGVPVYKLWGLTLASLPLTFATIGIGEPAVAQERVRQWLGTGDLRAFKIKLGSPAGIAADKTMFESVMEAIPPGSLVSVDANGGWDPDNAALMCPWLGNRGVDHVEQPIARGLEVHLPSVRSASPIPLLLDESIFDSSDLPRLLERGGFDGINVKLMKCGGPTEALRMIAFARERDLRTMVGCYYHTALGNAAGASLGPLVDYLDLDSHLNLKSDPFKGALLREGRLIPSAQPGFGVKRS